MSATYSHGGNIRRVAEEAGLAIDRILDFSSNVNPVGLPARAAERLAREAQDPNSWTHYPDPEFGELRSALSRYADVPPECIAIAAGADSLIHAALRTFLPRRCVIPVPAFSEYERACHAADCEPVFVQLEPAFTPDQKSLQHLRAGDLLILNNPHNPSGSCISRAEMLEHIAAAQTRGAAVLVDEAFIDYVPEESITLNAATTERIIAIRSLTKFFGCPGLRVGYAVAAPETVRKFTEQLPPWPVTMLAANAVAEALQDANYQADARADNRRARESLSTAFSSLGFFVFPSVANFLLIRLPADVSATEIRQHLVREHAILVRECESFAGLEPGRYLRIAVRSPHENQRLIDALAGILRESLCLRTHS